MPVLGRAHRSVATTQPPGTGAVVAGAVVAGAVVGDDGAVVAGTDVGDGIEVVDVGPELLEDELPEEIVESVLPSDNDVSCNGPMNGLPTAMPSRSIGRSRVAPASSLAEVRLVNALPSGIRPSRATISPTNDRTGLTNHLPS